MRSDGEVPVTIHKTVHESCKYIDLFFFNVNQMLILHIYRSDAVYHRNGERKQMYLLAVKNFISILLTDISKTQRNGSHFVKTAHFSQQNRGIHADVIVYIFAHLHTTLRTEENLLGVY